MGSMLERFRDAAKAFRYVLSGDAVVYNVRIEGKIDATDADRALIKCDLGLAE